MDEDQVAVEHADRRVEHAKESLRKNLRELAHRYDETKQKLDIRARIAEHPRAAIGIAFGLGVVLGMFGRSRHHHEAAAQGIGGTVMAALGALAFRALKEAALHEGGQLAKGWWADRTERDASRDPSVEAFLEH